MSPLRWDSQMDATPKVTNQCYYISIIPIVTILELTKKLLVSSGCVNLSDGHIMNEVFEQQSCKLYVLRMLIDSRKHCLHVATWSKLRTSLPPKDVHQSTTKSDRICPWKLYILLTDVTTLPSKLDELCKCKLQTVSVSMQLSLCTVSFLTCRCTF